MQYKRTEDDECGYPADGGDKYVERRVCVVVGSERLLRSRILTMIHVCRRKGRHAWKQGRGECNRRTGGNYKMKRGTLIPASILGTVKIYINQRELFNYKLKKDYLMLMTTTRQAEDKTAMTRRHDREAIS